MRGADCEVFEHLSIDVKAAVVAAAVLVYTKLHIGEK